jgi:hypothetical protein
MALSRIDFVIPRHADGVVEVPEGALNTGPCVWQLESDA